MTVVLHPMADRAMAAFLVALTCSGCAREYVHWEPDVSESARRADSLPGDRSARVQLVNGRVFEARNISFEGETLSWTEPGSGVVSSLLLSQVDSVRAQGERKIWAGALIGALAGTVVLRAWTGCYLSCDFDGPHPTAFGGIGAIVGALMVLGSPKYSGVTFVR